jgi:pimeloyl-ACP methyl ester carboxylesterase
MSGSFLARLFPLSHTRRSGQVALLLAALLVLVALGSDASTSRFFGAHDWQQRVVVLLPGVFAQPEYLPPRPDLPAIPLLPAPPDRWPDWPGWMTCGGEHALQNARARALGVFSNAYSSPEALTAMLNRALHAAGGTSQSSEGLPFHIRAIEAFSYAGNAPTYDSSQTRQPLAVSARALDAQFRRWLAAYPGASFDLIGHSLGGAVAAYWAASIATPDELQAVHSLITLDSPLTGIPQSIADRLFLPFFHPVAQDLLEGSPAIQTIARAPARWNNGPGTFASPIVTITNIRDYIVLALWATLPGAVLVADDYGTDSSSLNHGSVLTAPAALEQVAQILAAEGMPLLSAGGFDTTPFS